MAELEELQRETDVAVVQEPITTREEGVLHTFSGYMHSDESKRQRKAAGAQAELMR